MWVKLFLLTLYLLFLFIISRLLETATWYNDTGTFLSSFAVLDPFTLSVRKLKQLLDDRGVSYNGVVEKQELVELVKSSGTPTNDEILEEDSPANVPAESTQFTCGSHFYEEVEDTKDSAWLVQVVVDDSDSPLLPDATWKEVRTKVADFGVRTGVFTCSLDKRLCNRKGWTSARLILALPRGHKAKEDVVLHNFMLPSSSGTVLQWVRKHLSSRVKEITSASELKNWLTNSDPSKKTELRVIVFSLLKSCPLFLSALAIKFNGRVKFGTIDTSKVNYKKYIGSSDPPVYLVVTPEKTIVYGARRCENYNFKSMELFLRTLVPEINDVFLWSLILVNALAGFELFFMYSHMWKHFLLYSLCAVKYNCALFFMWLMILALFQFPFMQTCTDVLLRCLRFVSESNVASILRCDYKSFYSYTFLLVTYIIFSSIAGFFLKKLKWCHPEDTTIFSNWWYAPGDSTLSTYFFRQRVSLMRPFASQDHDLEVGIELLIERMAVPNLWLQPVISMDYIKDLPMWRYNGWCEADDELEESRNDMICSSDDEATSLIQPQPEPITPSEIETMLHNTLYPTGGAAPSQEQCLHKQHHTSVGGEVPSQNAALPYAAASYSPNISKPEVKRAPKGMLEFRECSICLESYRYSEVLCGLPCGHNFHMNCIMSWLSRDNHCCPICRWPSYKFRNFTTHLHSQ